MLKDAGAQVAICGRNEDRLNDAAAKIDVLPIRADVSKEEDVVPMVERVISGFGGYNVLINNAAFGYFAPLVEMELDQFNHMMATNLAGAMLVARESARHFSQTDYGNIINISSTSGLRGGPRSTAYGASKFALRGMTEVWRSELRKHNVRVMLLNPSEVLTNFAAAVGREQQQSERKLRAEEIAHAAISMLAMDDRGFVTELTVFATNPES